ncbi:MAG TPA: HXXEE domain-containing protein [Pyrinomonadaceae bacterium]|nr:HXXEE domain-containing protein [Pyrinomonadaceae bacterium]
MSLDKLSYPSVQWLAFAFLALHNLEEALTMHLYFPRIAGLLRKHALAHLAPAIPTPAQFYAALAGATLFPLILVVVATTGRPSKIKFYLVALVQAQVLLNVFVPHLPAAFVFGGYAPGLLTAVLVNLPFSVYFFRRSLREQRVTRRGLLVMLLVALPLLLLSIRLLYALGASFA